MPYIYVYSPSDFVGGLPDEQGAAAAGRGPFELTLAADAKPSVIEVVDDDGVLDEVDGNQTIASDANLDGSEYSAGTSINSAYDLIDTSSGHQVTSIHFGGNGYQQGAVHGIVSTEPLVAGETYTFNRERTSHRQDNQYDDFVACFVAGSRILTPHGDVAVEDLSVNQAVMTLDGGHEPVRMVLTRRLFANELALNPNLRPVRITAGAMGQGLPNRDLLVSPQHRMLVSGPTCLRVFGVEEALVSARKLTALNGVYVDQDINDVCYVHLVFEEHQVVFAEGAPSESFFLGVQAIDGLADAAREELLELFPEVTGNEVKSDGARFMPDGSDQSTFVRRLRQNEQQPLTPTLE